MTVVGIIFTVIIALLIGLLFYYTFKSTGPWGSFWTFFLILLLSGLAAMPWVEPVGPTLYDVAWIPITFIILLFAILLAAASPVYEQSARRTETPEKPRPDNEAGATAAALGVFFWILLLFFFIAIIAGFWAY